MVQGKYRAGHAARKRVGTAMSADMLTFATALQPSQMDDLILTVGVVGAGEVATKIHLPVLTAIPGIRLAYVADTSAAAAKAAGKSYGIESLAITKSVSALPVTDVVLLSTPVGARGAYYDLFALRGTAVLAEKPLAVSSIEALRLCRLFSEHALACGFQRRTYASVAIARTCVEQRVFGPIRGVRISEGARTTKTGTDARFYDDWSAGYGGVLRDLGSHSLDLVFQISGAMQARPLRQRFVLDGHIDREVEATLRFSGPTGEFDAEVSLTWLRDADNVLEFRFDSCILSLSSRAEGAAQLLDLDRRPLGMMLQTTLRRSTTTYQAFYLEWESFLAGVRGGQATAFSAASCLPTVQAVEALYELAGNQ